MDTYDRLQATLRHPEYQAHLNEMLAQINQETELMSVLERRVYKDKLALDPRSPVGLLSRDGKFLLSSRQHT